MKRLLLVLIGIGLLVCPAGAQGRRRRLPPSTSYTTTFPTTENPLSQKGLWINGLQTALDWQNCQVTSGGILQGAGHVSPSPPYDDVKCVLRGAWGAAQTIIATVKNVSPPLQANGSEEIECHLHATNNPHSSKGYEINWSLSDNHYNTIVRWEGPIGVMGCDELCAFTTLVTTFGNAINDGDVTKCTATADANPVITGYVNGVQTIQFTDSSASKLLTGNPGFGFFTRGTGNYDNFGFKPAIVVTSP